MRTRKFSKKRIGEIQNIYVIFLNCQDKNARISKLFMLFFIIYTYVYTICNGVKIGGTTGDMAPLVFWSQSLKKSRKVSKSKSHSLEVAPVVTTFVWRRWVYVYPGIPMSSFLIKDYHSSQNYNRKPQAKIETNFALENENGATFKNGIFLQAIK